MARTFHKEAVMAPPTNSFRDTTRQRSPTPRVPAICNVCRAEMFFGIEHTPAVCEHNRNVSLREKLFSRIWTQLQALDSDNSAWSALSTAKQGLMFSPEEARRVLSTAAEHHRQQTKLLSCDEVLEMGQQAGIGEDSMVRAITNARSPGRIRNSVLWFITDCERHVVAGLWGLMVVTMFLWWLST